MVLKENNASTYHSQLSLEIKPTVLTFLLILVPHLLIIILVFVTPHFEHIIKISLVLLILFSSYVYLKRYFFQQSSTSVDRIQNTLNQDWLITKNGIDEKFEPITANLLPNSYLSRLMIILNFVEVNSSKHPSQYSVIILRDSVSKRDYNHLYSLIKFCNVKED